MRTVAVALVCFLCTAVFPFSRNSRSSTNPPSKIEAGQNSVPRFEPSACVITIPESEKERVRCGYLVVHENHSRKDGRLIRLPIIILKSNSLHPAPDPVLRTLGGPGASSLRLVRGRPSSPWLNNRDLIIFEQRGTLYAQPKLDCPEVNEVTISNAKLNLTQILSTAREVNAAITCRDRLVKEGIDLAAYDSVQSAADIEDLRRVLGYEKWNLYGVSYSSRLMLEVMRDYPTGIRSVVLESVLPPSVNYDEVGIDGAMRALKVLFANCAAEAECGKAYPNLENVFYDVVRRTNQRPVSFSIKVPSDPDTLTIKLNGNDIIDWVLDYLLSVDADAIADAPLQIHRFAAGDFSALKSYAESKASQGSFYMLGMRYSVWCREEMPFENRRKIVRQNNRFEELRGYTIQGSMPAICDVWRVPPANPKENKPVKSNIPTLILAAEYDAYTPPEWGRLTARTLSKSFFFEVPDAGHGPGFSNACARRMAADFFNNPTKAPNADCLNVPHKRFALEKKESRSLAARTIREKGVQFGSGQSR